MKIGSSSEERSGVDLRDQAAVFIAKWSLPAILCCVMTMCVSAMFIDGDSIGIISAMITAVVGGLLLCLQKMSGADKEDPMSVVAHELIENLKRSEERNAVISQQLIEYIQRPHTTELNVGEKVVSLVDGNTRAVVGSEES